MRRRLLALTIVTAVLAALVPALPGYAEDSRAEDSPAVVWGACPPADPGVRRDPRQQCATLRVPLDYRKPHGRKIDLAISRILTAKPGLRRGILLSNPGGPGGPGLDLPSLLAALMPAEARDRYDLIGFDPRGIGHSTPVTCGMSPDTPLDLILPFPAPDGSIDRNVDFARRTAGECAARSGDLLPFISTPNTARDMDRIRVALRERKISYFGISYGSYLGAVYATMFAQRSDRFILDSAVDPRIVWYDQWRHFSLGFALRLPDFTAWAAARDARFHLGATPEAVTRTYFEVAARLDRQPVVLPDGLVFNGNMFRLITFDRLYFDFRFPELAEIWQAFAAGAPADPAALGLLRSPAPAAQVPADNLRAAQYSVLCADAAWPRDVDTYAHNVAVDRRLFPGTAGFPANVWPCAFWRFRPVEPPVDVTGRGPRNVLVLQNLRDPATPWVTGFGLRRALDGRAAMVSVDQGGHGVYLFTDAPCANDIATAFLARGALPARDSVCPGQSPPDVSARSSQPPLPLVPLVPRAPAGPGQ